MAELAAHLTDHVLPHLAARQWVLSVPKRLRPFLHHNPDIAGAVLRIFLRAIRTTLPARIYEVLPPPSRSLPALGRLAYTCGMGIACRGTGLALACLVTAGCTGRSQDTLARFRAFAAAADSFDMEALRDFYAPDVTWRLGPQTFHGVDQVMARHERDRRLGAQIERRDLEVSGDTVFATVAETSTLLELLGMPPLVHSRGAYVFRGGRITWKGPAPGAPPDSSMVVMGRYVAPFTAWWKEAHAELRDSLLDADGRPRADGPIARIRLRLAREYRVLQYLDAANRHDLPWIRRALTDDVTWDLMGDERQGVEEVMAPHEQDVVTETRLAGTVRRVSGDTVVADLVERSSFITALGFDSVAYTGMRFVLRRGKIAHIGPADDTSRAPGAFQETLGPFFAWVRQEHPDDWVRLTDENGRPRYGTEGGRTLMRLVQEWRR